VKTKEANLGILNYVFSERTQETSRNSITNATSNVTGNHHDSQQRNYKWGLKPSPTFKICSTNQEQLSQIELLLPQYGAIKSINRSENMNGYISHF
jgi:hypothetical protein